MANKTRNELKNYFQTGDKPTQQEYADLIDSFVHRLDDNFVETLPTATTTSKGIAEQATLAEAQSGVNNTCFVTPKGTKRAVETFAPVKSVNGLSGDVLINVMGDDSGWINASLTSPITNYSISFQRARYRKKNGVVYIEGIIKGGLATNQITLFNLPSGFRPSKSIVLNTTRHNNNTGFRTDVKSNGNVVCYSYDPILTSISGISFLAD